MIQRGVPVIGVDARTHFNSRPEHSQLGLKFASIVDRDELFGWLEREQPKLSGIVHLGACTDTTNLDEAFLERVNTDYSRKLWDYSSRHRIPFVYASSGATYGAGERGYDDDEASLSRLKPLNPYGESKHRFDLWALEQERRGNNPPSWSGFKFFNVYGFGERHKGKMASMALHWFDQYRATGEARLFKSYRPDYADGLQRRDFVYVGDVVDVLSFALEKPIQRGIFNLGSGQAHPFLDLAHSVARALRMPERVRFIDMPEELRERYQYLTEAKLERLRREGYTRLFKSLEDGVRETVRDLGRLGK
jgi:ADP-L-glycero-D-manno-heptose 6-epimerase